LISLLIIDIDTHYFHSFSAFIILPLLFTFHWPLLFITDISPAIISLHYILAISASLSLLLIFISFSLLIIAISIIDIDICLPGHYSRRQSHCRGRCAAAFSAEIRLLPSDSDIASDTPAAISCQPAEPFSFQIGFH